VDAFNNNAGLRGVAIVIISLGMGLKCIGSGAGTLGICDVMQRLDFLSNSQHLPV
jgi:hypothetical protein